MSGLNYNRKQAFSSGIIYTKQMAEKEGVPFFGENVTVEDMYDKDSEYKGKKVVETYVKFKDSKGKIHTVKAFGQLAKKIEDADAQGVKEFDFIYLGKDDMYHQAALHLWGYTQEEVKNAIAKDSMASYGISFDEAANMASLEEVNVANVKAVQDKVAAAQVSDDDDEDYV